MGNVREMKPEGVVEIQIQVPAELMGGVYSNNVIISHGAEEFFLDFICQTVTPPAGKLTARVIVAPGHFKRVLGAMQENLRRYEERFGEIKALAMPVKPNIVN